MSATTLHKKAESAAPLRVFRAAMRKMIIEANLPDYELLEEPGDLIMVSRRGQVVADVDAPILKPDTLEAARALRPGVDVYALEADWRSFWAESGRPALQSADKAFLGWVKSQHGRK